MDGAAKRTSNPYVVEVSGSFFHAAASQAGRNLRTRGWPSNQCSSHGMKSNSMCTSRSPVIRVMWSDLLAGQSLVRCVCPHSSMLGWYTNRSTFFSWLHQRLPVTREQGKGSEFSQSAFRWCKVPKRCRGEFRGVELSCRAYIGRPQRLRQTMWSDVRDRILSLSKKFS